MWKRHYGFIEWHGRDRKRLRDEFADHHIITGGDYNQTPDAATWYGTLEGRGRMTTAPLDLSFRCVTEEDFLEAGKRCECRAVDHLCMDVALADCVAAVGARKGIRSDGLRCSDHRGALLENFLIDRPGLPAREGGGLPARAGVAASRHLAG